MPIPAFNEIKAPALQLLSDGKSRKLAEIYEILAKRIVPDREPSPARSGHENMRALPLPAGKHPESCHVEQDPQRNQGQSSG